MRKLSSPVATFAYKTFLPGIGSFTFSTLALTSAPDLVGGLLISSAITTGLMLLTRRVKTVMLDQDCLIVAGYFKSIRVPLSQVTSVAGSRMVSPDRIWIRFAEPTPFGSEIVFLPIPRFIAGVGVHPLAMELSALCSAARTASPAERTSPSAS